MLTVLLIFALVQGAVLALVLEMSISRLIEANDSLLEELLEQARKSTRDLAI